MIPPKEGRLSSTKRGYGRQWSRARVAHLQKHPLCRMCLMSGHTRAADVVDHIKPHKGDKALFWDSSNWQSLCTSCHSGAKQQIENSGIERGCDANGMPIDRGHPWNG